MNVVYLLQSKYNTFRTGCQEFLIEQATLINIIARAQKKPFRTLIFLKETLIDLIASFNSTNPINMHQYLNQLII
jgi:hypothetical protein